MKNRRGLLQLEGLTERIVPAVAIRAIDGDLVISGIHNSGTLTINVSGDNQVDVTDGTGAASKNRGTYAVDGDLILNLSNRNDTVVINFTTDSRLDGSILANLGNGNDSLTIIDSAGADAGIFGSLVVDGGNGNDSLIIANTAATQLLTIEGALNFNGGAGLDILSINGDNAGTGRTTLPQPASPITIGGGLTMTRVNTVNVADDASAAAASISVTIDNNAVFNASADKLIANTVVVGGTKGDVTIAGALTVTGGQGTDGFTLRNVLLVDVVPAEDTVVEVNFSLDKGANTLTFDGVEMGIEGTDVDFVYVGGVGADKIDWATGDNTFSGDVTITLGKGNNEVDVDLGAGVSPDPVFAGTLTITGGDNVDNIDLHDTTVFGLATLALGNGANTLLSNGDFDGGLSYTGGAGVDTVTLTNGNGLAGDVSISVGANGDNVDITNTTTVSATSLTIDFGVGGADTVDFDTIFLDLVTLLNIGAGDSYTGG